MFDGQGNVVPCTLIKAGPCKVLQIKTKDKDRYQAIQIGFEEKTRNIKKTEKNKEYKRVRECRGEAGEIVTARGIDSADHSDKPKTASGQNQEEQFTKAEAKGAEIGGIIDVSVFQQGDKVKISGVSKGKGFQGGVKRHGFHGRNATHGVKHEQRTLGSVGSTDKARVAKGKKMPGRMGSERTTIKNLEVIKIDKDDNLIAVKGAVPGRRGTLLEIRG